MKATEPLLHVDLRHLVALKAVAQALSFSEAASELGYTQSAVSHQIAALERTVGTTLVERSKGRRVVSLTPAGEIVLRHTDAILGELQAVRANVSALHDGLLGTIRVGAFEELGAQLLAPVLDDFLDARPDASVQVRQAARPSTLPALIESGELDLAFVELPVRLPTVDAVELRRDRYVLLLPATGVRERRSWVSLPQLADHHLDDELRRHGIDPRQVTRCDDVQTARTLAAEGVGAAIVPEPSVDRSDARVRVVELRDGSVPPRVIGIAWHGRRRPAPAAQQLVDALRRPVVPRPQLVRPAPAERAA